jgi:hypothetical protein
MILSVSDFFTSFLNNFKKIFFQTFCQIILQFFGKIFFSVLFVVSCAHLLRLVTLRHSSGRPCARAPVNLTSPRGAVTPSQPTESRLVLDLAHFRAQPIRPLPHPMAGQLRGLVAMPCVLTNHPKDERTFSVTLHQTNLHSIM